MHKTRHGSTMFDRLTMGLMAALTVGTLSLPAFPTEAAADVLDTDIIYGKTITERSLNHEQAPNIFAPAAILIDTEGNTYFERNSNEERKIASTTKLMTALLAVENGSPEDIVSVTDQDKVIGSTAELLPGDQLTLDHALYGLMLPSGNDAAMAIARTLGAKFATDGGDPYVAFIDRMNARAKELGMEHTMYRNPSGLDYEEWDGDQHSTPHDLAILMSECLKSDWLKAIMKTGMFEITATNNGVARQINLVTTDELIGSSEEFLGGKTGQTDQAGSCFVGALTHKERTYISVVLGEQDRNATFMDTRELLSWAVAHVRVYEIGENDGTMSDDGLPIIAEIPHADWIDVSIPLAAETSAAKVYALDLNGEVDQRAHFEVARGDIKKGDVLGAIELRQDDKVIDTINLVSAVDSPRPSALRGFFIGIERFFRNLKGEPIVAKQVSHFETSGSGDSDDTGTDSGTSDAGDSQTSEAPAEDAAPAEAASEGTTNQ